MSNLYKGQAIVSGDNSTRVIDSNSLLEAKIVEFESKNIKRVLSPQTIEGEEADFHNEEGSAEEFSEGFLDAEQVDSALAINEDLMAQQAEVLESAKEEAEGILSEAREEAQRIIDEAMVQAERLKNQALEEGKDDGYQAGMTRATVQLQEEQQKLELYKQQLDEQYKQGQLNMEKDLVGVITEVVEKVFMIQFADKKELLIHLVENAITNTENSKEYQVKVSDKNYEFLMKNKSAIEEKVGADVVVDVIADPLLDVSECIIESDGGVFDCSIGVELENLIKDLKSLNI